jgi:hypothetical protein
VKGGGKEGQGPKRNKDKSKDSAAAADSDSEEIKEWVVMEEVLTEEDHSEIAAASLSLLLSKLSLFHFSPFPSLLPPFAQQSALTRPHLLQLLHCFSGLELSAFGSRKLHPVSFGMVTHPSVCILSPEPGPIT